ncbi:MAG: GspE/PulE family protein [Parcubacteria group bacterium]
MDDAQQKDKSLDDLLSPQARRHLKIASDDTKDKFEEKMHEIDIKEKERLTQERAIELGIDYIMLKGFPIATEVLSLIPEEDARRLKTVAFVRSGDELRLGSTDPTNFEVVGLLANLQEKEKVHGSIYLISEYSLMQTLKLYASIPKPRKFVTGVEITEDDFMKYHQAVNTFEDINKSIQDINISEIVIILIAGGIKNYSSDIHIEAEEQDIKIRYRIDGVLHDVAMLPKTIWPKVISRIKLLSELKINVSNVPQDGRFTIHLSTGYIDVRVSCVPTSFGESVVMRLLDSSAVGLELKHLGLREHEYQILMHEVKRPNGMILTVGPTGSGKTTTLYAFLTLLNTPERKIITLEHPVEYKIPGINQSEVNLGKEYTFANGLKSVLRQDPDVVMVGEVRDPQTADIAIQAALTGHLMLSTMHTNNAAGAIPRLLSLNVIPYLLAPALNVIIGQRLVRRLCQDCKELYTPSPEDVERVQKLISAIPEKADVHVDLSVMKVYRAKGCSKCGHIGYRGRTGIYEVMKMNPDIEQIILSGKASEHAMHEIAVRDGMVTMVQDGLIKALEGMTSLEEVFAQAE